MKFSALKLELQKRCIDLGMIYRPEVRYGEAINLSLSQYPLLLWQLTVNGTALDTIADQREYALYVAGLTDITSAEQVRRVWIDDSNGVPRETGRYEVQGSGYSLVLVLDVIPDDAYDITIEYLAPPSELSGEQESFVDDDWLLSKAILALFGEADWTVQDPQVIAARLEYWTTRLAMRERQLLAQRRHTSRKLRTTAWREYVT